MKMAAVAATPVPHVLARSSRGDIAVRLEPLTNINGTASRSVARFTSGHLQALVYAYCPGGTFAVRLLGAGIRHCSVVLDTLGPCGFPCFTHLSWPERVGGRNCQKSGPWVGYAKGAARH